MPLPLIYDEWRNRCRESSTHLQLVKAKYSKVLTNIWQIFVFPTMLKCDILTLTSRPPSFPIQIYVAILNRPEKSIKTINSNVHHGYRVNCDARSSSERGLVTLVTNPARTPGVLPSLSSTLFHSVVFAGPCPPTEGSRARRIDREIKENQSMAVSVAVTRTCYNIRHS